MEGWPDFVDHGAGPFAQGNAAPDDQPPTYVVAGGDRLDAIALRFDVPTWAFLATDGEPVCEQFGGAERALVPGETLVVVTALRTLYFTAEGDLKSTDDPSDGCS